jgi:DNA-binding protein HU-beta
MNKNELVAAIADAAGLTKADATKALDACCDAIVMALAGGDEVRLVGFGTFGVSHRKATEGRNPRTGAIIKIQASNQPKFKAGKQMKDAVNAALQKKAA